MDPRSSEPDWDSMDEDEDVALRISGRRKSLVDEGMKGLADPLLSQEPASVLPSYASLMDTDVGQDFSEDKLMNSGNLYSLYLLNSDSSEEQTLKNGLTSSVMPNQGVRIKKEVSDDEEEIDVENESGKKEAAAPRMKKKVPQPQENGQKPCDALFEGMPFYELIGKEVGPCAYCNMWRTIRYMSYCGRYPFCSVNCTKKFAVYKREQGELLEKAHGEGKPVKKLKVPTLFEEHKPQPMFPQSHKLADGTNKASCNGIHGNMKQENSHIFDWPAYLDEQDGEAAPVKCFHHAALSKEWKANLIGALVEVQNRDPNDPKDSFWVARIIRVAGYKARLRFEGFGMDNSHDFWVHLCKTECYPINGAVKAGMKLKPPKGVMERLGDKWLEHLARISHSGSPTYSLPKDKLKESFEMPFKKDMKLEVVYKRQVSSTCVATVKNVVGDRIHVQYDNCKDPSKDFWFHRLSPLIHPVGWSQRVGHPLIATAAYKSEALDKGRQKRGGPHDAPWEIFNFPQPINLDQSFRVGMKLEVIDPLKLSHICIGTVMRVLDEGYLMIGVDGCLSDQASWFCYHSNSSSLLPVGFCEYHHIDLVPPKDFLGHFDWDDYLRNTNSIATPVELFPQKTTNPGFKVGHKLEAVDLIESGLICAATIVKIAGPLLRVHFDGWDSSYDQWVDCQSPNIYPVGWCEMVGYPLQAPRTGSMLDYAAPVPVFKHNGKKIKISPGLRPDNKKRRSLSISFGGLANTKLTDNNLDSVYSFSDDEGMTGYQELLKPTSKKPQHSKKEKKEKKERKPSKPKPHKHQDKPNGKGRPESALNMKTHPELSSDSELKHLLTTIQVAPSVLAPSALVPSALAPSDLAPSALVPSALTPRATPKSSPKSGVATSAPKKPKKSKSSKKASTGGGFTLSSTEASILDGIFASISKESGLSSSVNSTSSSNATLSGSSSLSNLQFNSLKLSPKASVSKPSPASQRCVMKSKPAAMNTAATPAASSQIPSVNFLKHQKKAVSQGGPTLVVQTDPAPPTLNKVQDAPVLQTSDSALVDGVNEMPPLIPAGVPEPSSVPDANKFQQAFLMQLSESLKATKAKSDKKSKSKPKKSRNKDKDKESSKKSSKKDSKKDGKSKKEGKSKEKNKSPRPPKLPKTSHLAELLQRPGSLDFSNMDPKKVVNGFYVAGAAGGGPQENAKTESVVQSMLQSPQLVSPPSATSSSSKGSNPVLSSPRSVDSMVMQRTPPNPMEQKVFPHASGSQRLPHSKKADHTENRLVSPGVVNHSVLQNFDPMDDDFLQNCIDPNLLQKPSSREQRANSMDIGMLQRVDSKALTTIKEEQPFLPNSSADKSDIIMGVSNASSKTGQKSASNKTKTKPKPKPRPKKKKPTAKPVPRARSNSLPLPNVSLEAQNIMTNGMDLEMMQGMLSPGSRANSATLVELERTQQHILSSILHDHAHQAAPPEQLLQRQRAAMIMQEKFRELQQLQMQMQMSQDERPPMPPLVELRRPPIHMGFPGPQHAMFNPAQRHPGNQVPGMRMPMSSAATMMSQGEPGLTSPHIGQSNFQSMMSQSPQASVPPQSPQQSPNPQVPHSPQSMMVPSPQGMIPPPSPKSMIPRSPKSKAMPSPKSMFPNSPTSMPPPSPQSSSNSMMAASPQSLLPHSPQTSGGPNLQARLQQTSPTPGPTSPMMIMQGRSHAAGMPLTQQMLSAQSMIQSSTMAQQNIQNLMSGNPHGVMPQGAQPMMSPRGMMSPPIRYPSTLQSQLPFGARSPGQERNLFPYGTPLQSPQSSPTGAPAQRLPPLHSLLRPSASPLPSPHNMPSATLHSPVSNPISSPVQSPHPSPNSIHLRSPVFPRGIAPHQRQNHVPPGHHQLSPGQHQVPFGQHQMLPGHFQASVPIQQMARPGGFPVRMSFPSPPPGYVSPTSASIPRIPGNLLNAPATKTDSSTDVQTSKQQSPDKPAVGIMNPWEWSISDVLQFIADAGEGACSEPFRRQKIDGPKFMSLSKDQLANLTGMKVAPSLKIYQQIVRLRSMFPTQEQGNAQK